MLTKGIICLFTPNILLIIIFHKKSEYKEMKEKIILYVKKRVTTLGQESIIQNSEEIATNGKVLN
jgi:hypothetical protein